MHKIVNIKIIKIFGCFGFGFFVRLINFLSRFFSKIFSDGLIKGKNYKIFKFFRNILVISEVVIKKCV